jgi:hypothetical protein
MDDNMLDSNNELLLKELQELETEHKELDHYGNVNSDLDQITLQRIKKRKLFLKDQIDKIRSKLYPNIIA